MANSWLVYIVLIGFCTAQYNIEYAEQIYANTPSSSFVAIAPVGSPSSCSGNFFLLTNNTSNECFQIANNNYSIISRSCPTELRGSTSLSCVPQLCFALNPSLHHVVILHNNGTILTTFGSSQLLQPTIFTTTQRNNSFAEVIVIDGLNIWMFTVSLSTFQVVTSRQVVTVPQQVIGISMSSNTSIILAYTNSSSLTTYTVSTNTFGILGPQFGSIGSIITQDVYNRIHVYDNSCKCVKILTSSGTLQCIINLNNAPIFISQRRNSIFIVDGISIYKYVDGLSVSFNAKPRTCFFPISASIAANIYGGDYPLNVSLFPDFLRNAYATPGNYSMSFTTIQTDFVTQFPVIVFKDSLLKLLTLQPSTVTNRSVIPSTVFPPHSGNASFGFTFSAVATTTGQTLSIVLSAASMFALNTSFYDSISFWINVGEGGQYFKVELNSGGIIYVFNPGDLPKNTWKKININLAENVNVRRATSSFYTGLLFTDLLKTANQNMIYIDDIIITPIDFTPPNRKFYVFDACGIITKYDVLIQDNGFKANVNSSGVSCNAISTTSMNLTTDATINSYLQNGIPPFTYKWLGNNFTNANNINNIPALQSYAILYDNNVNSSWSWTCTADSFSLMDTATYVSPPYSISLSFVDEYQALTLIFPQDLAFVDYPILEFWFNGGNVSQQQIYLQYQRGGRMATDPTLITNLANIYAFPPNTWIKIRYEPGTAIFNSKFSSLLFYSGPIISQEPFYIDDIILYGKEVLVVTDSTGCSAQTRTLIVPSPPPLMQTVVINNVKCHGSNDGAALIEMSGGTPPYDYAWSIPLSGNTPSITKLNASDIYVNIADSKGCAYFKKEMTIAQPPPMVLNVTTYPIKCYGGKSIASASTIGGNAPYTYIWSSANTATTIAQPSPQPIFTESFSSQFSTLNGEVKCMGARQELQSSHSGYCSLFLPFGSSISNVSIVGCTNCMQLSKSSKLMFWIYITTREAADQLQLQFLKAKEIASPSIPLSSLTNSLLLEQWNEISLNLSISNDFAPDELMFSSVNPEIMGTIILDDIVIIPVDIFSTGDSVFPGFNSFVEIVASQYFISVVDANGCSSAKYNFTMAQPEAMSIYFEIIVPTSINGTDGSLFAKVAGGTPPYTYLWNTNETTQGIQGPIGGYRLRVTDSNGCIFEDTILITDSSNGIRSLRSFNSPLSGGLAAIIGAGLLVVLFAFVMLSMFWNSTGFSALGTFFSSTLLVGVLVGLAAAAVLLPKPTDQLCLAFPWLLGIAFILVYGCLFIKTWTLYRVWRRASNYQRTALTPAYIIIRIGIALLLEIVLLAVWTAIDPPRVTATNTVDNTMEYQCDTEHPTFWIIFLSTKGVWLLFGAVMSILTRNIAKEFNESENIAYAIYNNVVLLVIAIPLATLLKEIPGGRLVVEVVVVVLAFTFTTVVMFFKIWHRIILPQKLTGIPHHVGASKAATTASSSGGSSPASKKSKSSSDGNTSSAV